MLLAPACDRGSLGSGPASFQGRAAACAEQEPEAYALFRERCSSCHGEAGGGDGPASFELWVPPPRFQDPAWQASVSDSEIERAIVEGGEAVGRSRAMPAHPDLGGQPERVAALRRLVRCLGGAGGAPSAPGS